MIEDLHPDDVVHRVAVAMTFEQCFDAPVVERIRIVLEADDFFGDLDQKSSTLNTPKSSP